MDKFIHQDQIMIKRRRAFQLAQDQMYKNLSEVVAGTFESYGVVMDLGDGGISNDTSLKVTRSSSTTITIKAGYAFVSDINAGFKTIVLSADTDKSVAGLSNGIHYVHIDYKEAIASSGDEVYTPGKLEGADHIYLLRNNSANITIDSVLDPTKLVLAKISVKGGKLTWADSTLTIDESAARPYIDSDDTSLTTLGGLNADAHHAWVARVNDELIEYSDYAAKTFTIANNGRGKHDTIANVHRNGDSVVVSPIIDMRQTNKAQLRQGLPSILQKIEKGMINFNDGQGDRLLRTMKFPDVPNTPVLTSDNLSLIWLNQPTTDGANASILNDEVRTAQASKNKIDSIRENMADVRQDMSSADEGEMETLTSELSDYQSQLLSQKTNYENAVQKVNAVNKSFTTKRKYVVACVPDQPTLIDDEQIVQYEAEVRYYPLKSSSIEKVTGVKSYYKSTFLYPDSVNSFGDATYSYDETPAEELRAIQIPIQPMEKILIRVRAITKQGMISTWSDSIEYKFDELESSDIELAVALDGLEENSNPWQDGIITQEVVDKLFQLETELQAGLVEIRGIVNDFSTLQSQVDNLLSRVSDIEGDLTTVSAIVDNTTGSTL